MGNRGWCVFGIGLLCLWAHVGWSADAPIPARPNVLLILVDDLGYSDLGCYGSEIQTPNLDRLAQNGLRFTQFYNTARCWPSRGAILTGYYAQQIRRDSLPGVKSGSQGTRPTWARLLPQLLRPLGYRSYHSGKWHVDGKPIENGFDHSYSLEDHDRHFDPKRHTKDDQPLPPVASTTEYYSSTAIADHAIECLRDHAEHYSQQPFFEFLAFTAPHFPLHAPAGDIAKYADKYDAGWDALRQSRFDRQTAGQLIRAPLSQLEREIGPPYAFPEALQKLGQDELNRPLMWNGLSDAQRAFQTRKMAIHAAMVDRMDQEVGRVLAQLQAMNALDNTLIFFLSDNGASAEIMVRGDGHNRDIPGGAAGTFLSLGPGWSSLANTPFRRHKTWVHEGGIATPLIVHWPAGVTARGELRTTPGHVVDLVPTILEAAQAPSSQQSASPAPSAPGRSLLSAFKQDGELKRDYLWWLHEGNRALRVGDWKIVAAGKDAAWELYDLSTDRTETRNLAEAQPERVREMATIWEQHLQESIKLATADQP